MRVLLRDTRTDDYFAKELRWVRNPEGAAEFETVEAAGWRARECGRQDAISYFCSRSIGGYEPDEATETG